MKVRGDLKAYSVRYLQFVVMRLLNCYENIKLSKGSKIRNRYNQVPHLTQDTNGQVTNS